MKILIIGSNKEWAIENAYVKYLSEKATVSFYNARGLFIDFYHKNILNKIIFLLGLSNILKKINTTILKKIEEENPDIVWVFKGMEISIDTLKKLKRKILS